MISDPLKAAQGSTRTDLVVLTQSNKTKTYRKHTRVAKEGNRSVSIFDERLRRVGGWGWKGFDHVLE